MTLKADRRFSARLIAAVTPRLSLAHAPGQRAAGLSGDTAT
jgi:hypothetical protein